MLKTTPKIFNISKTRWGFCQVCVGRFFEVKEILQIFSILRLSAHGDQEESLDQPKMSKKIGDVGFVRLDL